MNEYREGVYDKTLRKDADSHRAARAALDAYVHRLAAIDAHTPDREDAL